MNLSENEKNWLVFFDEALRGPISAVEIKKGLSEKKLNADDSVIKKGSMAWKRIKQIPLFAHDAKKSPGTGCAMPADLPIPSTEEFNAVITPLITTSDLKKPDNWSKRRLAIVGGTWVLLGGVGGVAAAVMTSKTEDKKRQEDAMLANYINKENK